jgi:dolichyl-phosphate-mannose--protein O-mannosyl transferase
VLKTKRDWVAYATIGATLGFFYYFFPILGALPIPANAFMKWMWLQSWI